MKKLRQFFSSYWTWAILLVTITIGFYPIARYALCLKEPKDIIEAYVILGSFISGAAFIGFLHATKLQRIQLELQTEEIKLQRHDLQVQQDLLKETIAESKEQNRTIALQRFENTFFNMINSLSAGLHHIQFTLHSSGGRNAFKSAYDHQKNNWRQEVENTLGLKIPLMLNTDYREHEKYVEGRDLVYKNFASLMKTHFYDFNQTYFETILTCVDLIRRNKPVLGSEFDEYHKILLAHLSIYEKWELFIYVDAFDHRLKKYLRGNNFFRDLTDKNFEDPEIFHAFKRFQNGPDDFQ